MPVNHLGTHNRFMIGLVAIATDRAIRFSVVMSASDKPRLAGRQPSNRGGVPRVIDQVE
jgi:hypothetical protein